MYWPILLYALIPFLILMLLIIIFHAVLASMQVRAADRLGRQAREDEVEEGDAGERADGR